MRKGAIEMSSAGSLILMLAVAFILILVMGLFISAYATSSDTIECQWSQVVREVIPGGNSLIKLSCPRRFIAVTDEPLRLRYTLLGDRIGQDAAYTYPFADEDRTVPKTTVRTGEELNGLVAHEMQRCWQLFDQGERDALSSHALVANKKTCAICTEIATHQAAAQPTQSIGAYLTDTALSNTSQSYAQSLFPTSQGVCAQAARDNLADLTLAPGQQYAVTYRRAGAGSAITSLLNRINVDSNCQTVIVVPITELAQSCDFILN